MVEGGADPTPRSQRNAAKKGIAETMANTHPRYIVYVLSGASNAGKTTTLNHLAWLVGKLPGAEKLDGPNPVDATTGMTGDAQYCFRIPVGENRLVIGISTGGDTDWAISNGFDYFDKRYCEMCFIASKTCGCSVRAVESEAKQRGIIPRFCYLINERNCRSQMEIEQEAAAFLCSFVTLSPH